MERSRTLSRSPVRLLVVWATIGFVAFAATMSAASAEVLTTQDGVSDDLGRFGSLDEIRVSKDLDPIDISPDLVVLIAEPGAVDSPWVVDARARLLEYAGIKSVAVGSIGADETTFYLWLVDPRPAWLPIPRIAGDAADLVAAAANDEGELLSPSASVGGRALSDHSIAHRFDVSVRWLALLAAALAAVVAWRSDWRRGLLFGLAVVGSVLFGSRVAVQVSATFDGTMATSSLLGAVAASAMALVVCLRIMRWYRNPVGSDGADMIRNSVVEVVNDVLLVLGGLVVVVGLLWIGGGLFRPLATVLVGALVGAAFSSAIAAPGLAVLHRSNPRSSWLTTAGLPDGRQLMLLTIIGLVAILGILGVFMFRAPGLDLIDYRSLPEDDLAQTVGQRLGAGPGDPTEAVVAVGSAEAVEQWAQSAAALPHVAWVDTQTVRYTGIGFGAVDPIESLASEIHLGSNRQPFAVVVPSVAIRGPDGAQLLDDLGLLADDSVELEEAANSFDRGSTALAVVAVVLLALVGSGFIMVETDNLGYTVTSFVLRIVGGAATAGIYRLLVSEATVAEVLSALGVVAVLVGMFELEFFHDRLHRETAREIAPDTVDGVHDDDRTGPAHGLAAIAAAGAMLVAALVVALSRFGGGGPTVGRFGLALAIGLLVEIAVGLVVLRPALFGEDAAYHTVARPFRSTLHSGQRPTRNKPVSVDDPYWRRLVTDLLIAEFGLQTDPESTRLELVFLDRTPLFHQVTEQQRNLSDAHLRVTGRVPRLRKVETFREGPSSMVSVTVDHPERHLVDHDGTVYGVRKPERRSTMLWLVSPEPGHFRIAESVELGSVSLDQKDKDGRTPTFPEVASMMG